jgi:hypothetical protein
LLATFPVLALTLLFGGVPAGQFWRVLLVLVTTFFFSLARGIFVSAISRNARRAMLGTVSWLVLFNVAFPAAGALVRELSAPHSSSLPDLLMLPCPIFTQAQTEAAAGGPSIYFWPSVGCQAALTLVFLAMASWLLPGAWQDRPAEAWRDRWRARWENWAYGDPARRAQWRARWLERNPMSWLSGRNRFQSASVWCLFGVCFVFWELGCLASGAIWYNEGIYFPTVLVLNSVLKFWVALTAGRSLAEDRQSGALELILSTPLSVEGILRGQLLALLRKFLGPIVAVLGIHIIFLAASLQREPFADNPINPTLWIAVMLMLVLDLAALSWVAMWGAMTRKNPNRVTSITLVRVLATPWLLFIALQIVGVLCVDLSPPFPWEVNVGLWFSIGLLVDLGFGFAAWWQLRNGFRQFACSRYVPIPSPFSLASLKRRWWMAG